jgi:hypothetical protein
VGREFEQKQLPPLRVVTELVKSREEIVLQAAMAKILANVITNERDWSCLPKKRV